MSEKLRTLDHGRPWRDDQFDSLNVPSNCDMTRCNPRTKPLTFHQIASPSKRIISFDHRIQQFGGFLGDVAPTRPSLRIDSC